jgi:hypothetical protein
MAWLHSMCSARKWLSHHVSGSFISTIESQQYDVDILSDTMEILLSWCKVHSRLVDSIHEVVSSATSAH